MKKMNIYIDYLNNKCVEVWKEISFWDFDKLDESQTLEVSNVIKETLHRIDKNVKMIYDVFYKNGFVYKNFGGLNSLDKPYLLRPEEDYHNTIQKFYDNCRFLSMLTHRYFLC